MTAPSPPAAAAHARSSCASTPAARASAKPTYTGPTPFAMSSRMTSTPAFAPDVRITFVAPVAPLPYSRMSMPRVRRPMISPNCTEPTRYPMTALAASDHHIAPAPSLFASLRVNPDSRGDRTQRGGRPRAPTSAAGTGQITAAPRIGQADPAAASRRETRSARIDREDLRRGTAAAGALQREREVPSGCVGAADLQEVRAVRFERYIERRAARDRGAATRRCESAGRRDGRDAFRRVQREHRSEVRLCLNRQLEPLADVEPVPRAAPDGAARLRLVRLERRAGRPLDVDLRRENQL